MAKAISIINSVRPMDERIYEALRLLKSAYNQADMICAMQQHQDERQHIRAIYGADVEID